MVFQNLTMDFAALGNITPLEVNISATDSMVNVARSANSFVNDLLIFGSIFLIIIYCYLALSDKTPFTDFGFDDLRALTLSSGIGLLMALTILEIGWSNNFYAIGMIVSIFVVSFILVAMGENRE